MSMHPLNKEIAQSLVDTGEFFFKGSQPVLDCFGLAFEREHSIQAIDKMISFTKQLKSLRCELKFFGFRMIDLDEQKIALTYTIESTRHDNEPLWVNEVFKLETPLLSLANDLASLWINAYKSRPEIDILKVANNK